MTPFVLFVIVHLEEFAMTVAIFPKTIEFEVLVMVHTPELS